MTDSTTASNLLLVTEENDGQRVDNFLLRHFRYQQRSLIYKIIRTGQVRLNGARCKPSTRVVKNNVIRLPPSLQPGSERVPQLSHKKQREILRHVFFSSEHLLAVNKPAGLPVHSGSGFSYGLIEALRSCFGDKQMLELVHRIDRLTSGCVLVARSAHMRNRLHELWRMQCVKKVYCAVVHGHWSCMQVIDLALRVTRPAGHVRVLVDNDNGKASCTVVRPLLSRVVDGRAMSLIILEPRSGRMHQLRVHCQSVGHPIVGDPRYQNREQDTWARRSLQRELYLHAHSIAFADELANGHKTFTSPDEDWQQALQNLDAQFATAWSDYVHAVQDKSNAVSNA